MFDFGTKNFDYSQFKREVDVRKNFRDYLELFFNLLGSSYGSYDEFIDNKYYRGMKDLFLFFFSFSKKHLHIWESSMKIVYESGFRDVDYFVDDTFCYLLNFFHQFRYHQYHSAFDKNVAVKYGHSFLHHSDIDNLQNVVGSFNSKFSFSVGDANYSFRYSSDAEPRIMEISTGPHLTHINDKPLALFTLYYLFAKKYCGEVLGGNDDFEGISTPYFHGKFVTFTPSFELMVNSKGGRFSCNNPEFYVHLIYCVPGFSDVMNVLCKDVFFPSYGQSIAVAEDEISDLLFENFCGESYTSILFKLYDSCVLSGEEFNYPLIKFLFPRFYQCGDREGRSGMVLEYCSHKESLFDEQYLKFCNMVGVKPAPDIIQDADIGDFEDPLPTDFNEQVCDQGEFIERENIAGEIWTNSSLENADPYEGWSGVIVDYQDGMDVDTNGFLRDSRGRIRVNPRGYKGKIKLN